MPAYIACDAVAPTLQAITHPLGCGFFLKRQLGKFVQVLARFAQRGLGPKQVRDLAKTGVTSVHFRLSA
jgi:hypothetical protein